METTRGDDALTVGVASVSQGGLMGKALSRILVLSTYNLHALLCALHFVMGVGNFGRQAVAEGPRATDRFAAVTAAFVAGLAGTARAAEVPANFLAALASRMEAAIKVSDFYPSPHNAGSSTLASSINAWYVVMPTLSSPC